MNFNRSLRVKIYFLLIFSISIVLISCIKPPHIFSYYVPPSAPDYSDKNNWAALPDKSDSADAVPLNSNERDLQSSARADVFYIHPTMFYSSKGWNGDLKDEKLNERVDKYPVRMQASSFNSSCKIYAPRYRQATLYSFFEKKGNNGEQALAIAYEDVLNAFDYYIKNYNNGRPFIIASHSQGSRHAYKLLNDKIEKDPSLRKRFICAYIIGFATDTTYEDIVPCDSSEQTGCLISWNTYKWGATTDNKYVGKNKYCINPLTWKRTSDEVGSELNFGGVDQDFKLIANVADAKINNGILWVHKPTKGKFRTLGKNYHVCDYSFFYMNIRRNAEERVNAYFNKQ